MGAAGAADFVHHPRASLHEDYGLTHEQLAMVSVVQPEWAAKNPRATFKTPVIVEDVLNPRVIAYPFWKWPAA
jgi:acetyl-CoA acetyltransferase